MSILFIKKLCKQLEGNQIVNERHLILAKISIFLSNYEENVSEMNDYAARLAKNVDKVDKFVYNYIYGYGNIFRFQ